MANVPITSLPQASTVAKTDQLILQGNSTQRATLAKILADLGVVNPDTAQDDMLQLTTPAGAAAHNCVYRGKALGRDILATCERLARGEGRGRLYCEVHTKCLPVLQFFKTKGYRVLGPAEAEAAGIPMQLTTLEKML